MPTLWIRPSSTHTSWFGRNASPSKIAKLTSPIGWSGAAGGAGSCSAIGVPTNITTAAASYVTLRFTLPPGPVILRSIPLADRDQRSEERGPTLENL